MFPNKGVSWAKQCTERTYPVRTTSRRVLLCFFGGLFLCVSGFGFVVLRCCFYELWEGVICLFAGMFAVWVIVLVCPLGVTVLRMQTITRLHIYLVVSPVSNLTRQRIAKDAFHSDVSCVRVSFPLLGLQYIQGCHPVLILSYEISSLSYQFLILSTEISLFTVISHIVNWDLITVHGHFWYCQLRSHNCSFKSSQLLSLVGQSLNRMPILLTCDGNYNLNIINLKRMPYTEIPTFEFSCADTCNMQQSNLRSHI